MWLLYNNSPQRQCHLTCLWMMQCSIAMQLLSNVCLRMFGDSLRIVQALSLFSCCAALNSPRFVDEEKLSSKLVRAFIMVNNMCKIWRVYFVNLASWELLKHKYALARCFQVKFSVSILRIYLENMYSECGCLYYNIQGHTLSAHPQSNTASLRAKYVYSTIVKLIILLVGAREHFVMFGS